MGGEDCEVCLGSDRGIVSCKGWRSGEGVGCLGLEGCGMGELGGGGVWVICLGGVDFGGNGSGVVRY